jgi:hypothetical protein
MIAVNPKRVIKSKDLLTDIKAGMSSSELMEKYKLSLEGFRRVIKALIDASNRKRKVTNVMTEAQDESPEVKEMRQFPRKSIDFPLWVYGDVEQIEYGFVQDVSEKGVRVQGIDVGIGEERTFVVRYAPGDRRQPFVFEATCRWVNSNVKSPNETVAGFEITSISNLDAERLQDILV